MGDQLRLRPEKRNRPSTLLDIEASDRLLFKIRDLNAGQQLELRMRAADALERAVDQLAHLGELSNQEIAHRYAQTRADLDALAAERERRRQCGECGTHQASGHTLDCELGRAA
jgi:hypothetical protein